MSQRALAREQTRRNALSVTRALPPSDGGFDTDEVMQILPHRFPFLMVDRIISFESETKCIGIKTVTINEPFFQGHFPGRPLMPGVLLTETMATYMGISLMGGLTWKRAMPFFEVRLRPRTPTPRSVTTPGASNRVGIWFDSI